MQKLPLVRQAVACAIGLTGSTRDQENLTCMHGLRFTEIAKGNMQKASVDFRELFLSVGGYIQISFLNLSSKCRFFLDLWHAHHEPQTYLFNASELTSSHRFWSPNIPHHIQESLRHPTQLFLGKSS